MNMKFIGNNTLIRAVLWGGWLLPAVISIYVIEQHGPCLLRMLGAQIDIKSSTDIFIFYSGVGATIAGILLTNIALVLTLNGQVRFAIFQANGSFRSFVNLCFTIAIIFILCSFCSIAGLYGILPLKVSTYLFVSGLWGLPLIGLITKNLLTDPTKRNSAIEGGLERISSQLDLIARVVSKNETTDNKTIVQKDPLPVPNSCETYTAKKERTD